MPGAGQPWDWPGRLRLFCHVGEVAAKTWVAGTSPATDVKLCRRLEGIRPRATEISPDSPALRRGEGGARASGRVRGIPGDSGRITPERAAKRGGEGGSRHGRPRSLRGSARLWQETSKDCKQR